jgi:two-component system sensor histidine kinase/response regulator
MNAGQLGPRAGELFQEQLDGLHGHVDKLFGLLMAFQFVGAIVWAAVAAPLTWSAGRSWLHPHVILAVVMGGLIALPIIFLVFYRPGQNLNRYAIAVGQMLMSGLLIHLSGGRIETHFHVFGSLAFLAFYRDWKVLIPATIVVAADHVVRGVYLPASVYGVPSGAEWRFLEHAGWVVFEDVFLFAAIVWGRKEMVSLAQRQALVEEKSDEAERANHAKSDFLSRMSHELRTPLNAILGFAQLIDLNDPTPAQREASSQILRGGKHLLQLINEVLDISKIEAGSLSISAEPVLLAEVVEQAMALVAPLADDCGITIVCDLSEMEGLCVKADRQRLLQVVINLATNAVKYNKKNGLVDISASRRGDKIRLEIVDTWTGIAPELRRRVFVPFDRLDSEKKGGVEGTGLGLSLSKSLVEVMGGSIGFESELGVGSTFFIELQSEHPSVLSEQVMAELLLMPKKDANLKILYIEDNESNIMLMRHVMATRPEWALSVAENGFKGLDMIDQERPDVLLLDLDLPDISGSEVFERLKAKPELGELRILIVSADATTKRIDSLMSMGADGYITKPFDVIDLVTKIANLNPVRVAEAA